MQNPERVLLTTAEVALRSTVGNMTIDAVITEERARVQDETRTFLKRLLEEYGSGILVTDVRLQVADPPEEVRDAFQEVVRARLGSRNWRPMRRRRPRPCQATSRSTDRG